LREQLNKLTEKADSKRELCLNDVSKKAAQKILQNRARMDELKTLITAVSFRCQNLSIEAAESDKARTLLEQQAAAAEKEVKAGKADYEKAKQSLANWQQVKKQRARRRDLETAVEELKREAERREAPTVPEDYSEDALPTVELRFSELRKAISTARERLQIFEDEQRTECPTCGTKTDRLGQVIEDAKKLVSEGPKRLAKLERRIVEYREYRIFERKHQTWRVDFEARQRAATQELAHLEDLQTPSQDANELERIVRNYDECVAKWDSLGRSVSKKAMECERLAGEHKTSARHLQDLESNLSDVSEDDERVDRAKQRLQEDEQAQRELAAIEGEIKPLKQQRLEKKSALEQLQTKLGRSKRLQQMAGIVEEVRDLFHCDSLPRKVAQRSLHKMEKGINRGLKMFGEPFWVKTDESLNFIINKPGEPPQPAGWISTGQSVMLALAFWPEIASIWAQDPGILALDEPTANLDYDNRQYLAEALQQLTSRVRGNRQIFIVTHDLGLRTAFDQVITLEKQT
jgi:DNA repair exonuclease SbcCD ATPase subunit